MANSKIAEAFKSLGIDQKYGVSSDEPEASEPPITVNNQPLSEVESNGDNVEETEQPVEEVTSAASEEENISDIVRDHFEEPKEGDKLPSLIEKLGSHPLDGQILLATDGDDEEDIDIEAEKQDLISKIRSFPENTLPYEVLERKTNIQLHDILNLLVINFGSAAVQHHFDRIEEMMLEMRRSPTVNELHNGLITMKTEYVKTVQSVNKALSLDIRSDARVQALLAPNFEEGMRRILEEVAMLRALLGEFVTQGGGNARGFHPNDPDHLSIKRMGEECHKALAQIRVTNSQNKTLLDDLARMRKQFEDQYNARIRSDKQLQIAIDENERVAEKIESTIRYTSETRFIFAEGQYLATKKRLQKGIHISNLYWSSDPKNALKFKDKQSAMVFMTNLIDRLMRLRPEKSAKTLAKVQTGKKTMDSITLLGKKFSSITLAREALRIEKGE